MTPLQRWARKVKLNPNTPTTLQFYANRHLTVQEYIAKFRKARLKNVLPAEALPMSVEDALRKKIVGDRNVRKLLTSGNEKFKK